MESKDDDRRLKRVEGRLCECEGRLCEREGRLCEHKGRLCEHKGRLCEREVHPERKKSEGRCLKSTVDFTEYIVRKSPKLC
jgi:hypothetical protein